MWVYCADLLLTHSSEFWRALPPVYRRSNENLNRLATKIESGLIFAHVRAAYPGMPVSEQNCHPFQWGRYMWMHNGVVAGFMEIRRKLLAQLSDEAYNAVQSFHSDSAVRCVGRATPGKDLAPQRYYW